MTFGEALLEVLSFFWSPLFVLLVLSFLTVMSFVAMVYEFSDNPAGGFGLGVVFLTVFATLLVLLVTVLVYADSNGVTNPLTWRAQ